MGLEKSNAEGKSLRLVLPNLYNYFITELGNLNIHSYDILANVVKETDGYQITIRYGTAFSKKHSELFTEDSIENAAGTCFLSLRYAQRAPQQYRARDQYKNKR